MIRIRLLMLRKSWRQLSTVSPQGLSQFGGVHGSRTGATKMWRNKPLLRGDRDSVDKSFKTGGEAVSLLVDYVKEIDQGRLEFISSCESVLTSLGAVFDRMPKYAWVMKQLLEPERSITFRVAWLDDQGIQRVNRGFRVQYSSALGPFEGGQNFSPNTNLSTVKAQAFDTTLTNALSVKDLGGAFGGADINPYRLSETEIQRFIQSYMTELSKYIGPDQDLPGLGKGVGPVEIGYMYGQYKRINSHHGQIGKGLLWGGTPVHIQAQGFSTVYFAKRMLADKGQSLEGKMCLITGSNATAVAVAEKLLELGAVPITFTDQSGFIYEPQGFDYAKLKTITKIKTERGARVGRYIIASTSAKFNDPPNIYDIPCDLVFACSAHAIIDEKDVASLVAGGCQCIVEGTHQALSPSAISFAKKRNVLHGPYRATQIGATMVNGLTLDTQPFLAGETLDSRIESTVSDLYEEIKDCAKEFNTRGDLNAGANITAFLRVADAMIAHGSV